MDAAECIVVAECMDVPACMEVLAWWSWASCEAKPWPALLPPLILPLPLMPPLLMLLLVGWCLVTRLLSGEVAMLRGGCAAPRCEGVMLSGGWCMPAAGAAESVLRRVVDRPGASALCTGEWREGSKALLYVLGLYALLLAYVAVCVGEDRRGCGNCCWVNDGGLCAEK